MTIGRSDGQKNIGHRCEPKSRDFECLRMDSWFSSHKTKHDWVCFDRYTYILQAGGTQTLSLLVTGILDGLDLGGLVALVQANGDFVADSHRTVVYKTFCQCCD